MRYFDACCFIRKRITLLLVGLLWVASRPAIAVDPAVIQSMDAMTFHGPETKGKVELVDGKIGKALKFSFENDCRSAFSAIRLHPSGDWDRAAGFSFWVKGDGSNHLGGLEFIWNDDYAQRYGYAFPLNSTEWQKIIVRWGDLIPEVSAITKWIDAQGGNAPSKLVQLAFGKWWYWKDYAAHSYTIGEIRLEPTIDALPDYKPVGDPLSRVRAKLKDGHPVTIVTIGDSLTDYDHWSNKETNWPTFLKDRIKAKYGSDVTIVNPAMGGTDLRQNMVITPRWSSQTPGPDLVTIWFGSNDFDGGMRGDGFYQAQKDAVERVRRITGGKADVMLLSTRPPMGPVDKLAEMADATCKAARDVNAGLADIHQAYGKVAEAERPALYAWDKVHLGKPGQELVAQSVLDALGQG